MNSLAKGAFFTSCSFRYLKKKKLVKILDEKGRQRFSFFFEYRLNNRDERR